MNLFDDLLTNDGRKKASEKIYDKWGVRRNLDQNVSYSIKGLRNLLEAVKSVQKASEFIDGDSEWYESVKQDADAIALLLEQFAEEFKPLYEDISNKYLAEKMMNQTKDNENDNAYGTMAVAPSGSYYTDDNNNGWEA